MVEASFIFLRWLALFLAMTTGFLIGAERYIASKIDEYKTKTSRVKVELDRYRKELLKAEEVLKRAKKTPLPSLKVLELTPEELNTLTSTLKSSGVNVSSVKRGNYLIIRASASSENAIKALASIWPSLNGSVAGFESYREDKGKVSLVMKFLVKIKKRAGR